jgi:predicted RNA-binding Zn-ribbon protein involved in translation (DUF1610 family)
MEARPQIDTGPRGVCSLFGNPIAIGAVNIAVAFSCPSCGRTVRVSKAFRVLLDLLVYWLPIFVLFHLKVSILLRILLYPVLAVAIGFIFSFAGKRLFVLRFSEIRQLGDEQF